MTRLRDHRSWVEQQIRDAHQFDWIVCLSCTMRTFVPIEHGLCFWPRNHSLESIYIFLNSSNFKNTDSSQFPWPIQCTRGPWILFCILKFVTSWPSLYGCGWHAIARAYICIFRPIQCRLPVMTFTNCMTSSQKYLPPLFLYAMSY